MSYSQTCPSHCISTFLSAPSNCTLKHVRRRHHHRQPGSEKDQAGFSVSKALREFSLHLTGTAHVSHLSFPCTICLPFPAGGEITARRAVKKSVCPQDGCPSVSRSVFCSPQHRLFVYSHLHCCLVYSEPL